MMTSEIESGERDASASWYVIGWYKTTGDQRLDPEKILPAG